MLTIKRTCSNRVITRALLTDGAPLIALLRHDAEDCEVCENQEQLQRLLAANPGAMIVHNQQADALALVERLDVSPEQIFIEIRQDTRGVLGLQAYHKHNRAPEPLELLHT